MPMGTRHDVVGILLQSHEDFVLEVIGGGTWRLDCGWRNRCKMHKMVGQRARITGVRVGFDILDVETIDLV